MKDHANMVAKLRKLIFKCPNTQLCDLHKLNKEHICLDSHCRQYLIPQCKDCSHNHKLVSVKKVVPMLTQWLIGAWDQIRIENKDIESEWSICEVNLDYCIDILLELKRKIGNRKVHEMPVFECLVESTAQMMVEGHSLEFLLHELETLNRKFGVFQGCQLQTSCLTAEREFRSKKWIQTGQKAKHFTEKALAFSETLAQIIEEQLRYQKRSKKLDKLHLQRLTTLSELLKNGDEARCNEVSSLKLQANESNQEQSIVEYLQKCRNLQSLYINNRNGKIHKSKWKFITNKLEYLNRLKQLKLHVKAEDLLTLTQQFREKPHSVRHVEVLYLTITDQQKLDLRIVAEFCNTLQLKEAHLVLTRNNVDKKGYDQFAHLLRVHTSLSQLPMNNLQINLSKNRIQDPRDRIAVETSFAMKCRDLKNKSITL